MGRPGSGRKPMPSYRRRPVVEDMWVLDVLALYREGYLKPGTNLVTSYYSLVGHDVAIPMSGLERLNLNQIMPRRLVGECKIAVFQDYLELRFSVIKNGHRPQEEWEVQFIFQSVDTIWDKVSNKPKIICPSCGRTRIKLFRRHSKFICKKCGGLSNKKQYQTACERKLLKAIRIRRKLGARGDERLLGGPFPKRPKGMKQVVYER